MGDGAVVTPEEGVVVAPEDGTVLFLSLIHIFYGNNVANSNIAVGEILEVLSATKTAVKNTYNQNDTITYVAVSYTHLDVYKRQGTLCFPSNSKPCTGLCLQESMSAVWNL